MITNGKCSGTGDGVALGVAAGTEAGVGFAEYTRALSSQHRTRLIDPTGHDSAVLAGFAAEAAESLIEQAVVERADRGSFEEYLARTLGPVFA